MQSFRPATLLKSDSNTGVSCEYWEIFKSTYFKGWLLLELSNKASRDGENYILHTIYLKKNKFEDIEKKKEDMLLKIVKKNTIQKYTRKFCYTRQHLYWSLLVESSPQVFSSKFCDIFKYTVFCRTSPVAASVNQEENHKENL